MLPVKLHRFLVDLDATRPWWSDPFKRSFDPVPKLLSITLERLAENPVPHTTAAVDRLAVLDDLGHGTIANDVSTMVAYVSGIIDGAQKAIVDLQNEEGDLDDTLTKLSNMVRFARGLSSQLANEMQPTIGMQPTDYAAKFT